MHIRSRLVILVVCVLLPAMFGASYAVWYVYQDNQAQQSQALTEAARALSLLVENDLERREAALLALARSPSLLQRDLESFNTYARSVAVRMNSNILLTDPNGKPVFNARLADVTNAPKTGSNLFELREQYGSDRTLASDLYTGAVSGTLNFAVQVPVYIDEKPFYYLAMVSPARSMQNLLEQQRLPASWHGVIIDRKGLVIARTRDPEKFVGTKVTEALYQRLQTSREGVHHGTNLEGRKSAGFFSHTPGFGWTVLISVPHTELYRSAEHAALVLGGVMLASLLLALAIARLLGRRTAEPIESLRLAAEKLGKGEPVDTVCTGIMEMDAVAHAMSVASKEIRQGKSALERRVADAVAAAEQAQRALLQAQKLEALGRLTGGIAHDFNNLLQTLVTSLQLAQMINTEPRLTQLLETSQRAIERATALTRQLSTFGRVQEANMRTVALDRQVSGIGQLLKSAVPGNVALRITADDALWPVRADPLQLELAMLNIVINARDAMPDGGQIEVGMRNRALSAPPQDLEAGDYVEISIRDNGKGMPAEVLAQALDPFYTTKPVGEGTGLGLPQAYGFSRQAGGALTLESEPGRGTTVTLYLPRVPEESEKPEAAPSARMSAGASNRLLFVDDDPLVREAVVSALGEAGFEVTVARDGEEAMALLESGRSFDAVFSDIVMPGKTSGIDIAHHVHVQRPGTRIVLATGYSDKRIDLPGVALLRKPYDIGAAVRLLRDGDPAGNP